MAAARGAGAWALAALACACGGSNAPLDAGDPVAEVLVSPGRVALAPGDTVRFWAVARAAAGRPLEGRPFVWGSERDDLASVDLGGLVTAMAEGTTRVSARVNDISGFAEVQITARPPSAEPLVMRLEPQSIQAGWGSFTVTVLGSGFGPFSRIRWNGLPLESLVVDETEIQATVPGSYVAHAGVARISVETSSPDPSTSNALSFVVRAPPASSVEVRVAAAFASSAEGPDSR